MLPRLRTSAGGGGLGLAALPLVALTSLPLLLFAYLGQFSRMMGDDYARFATALQMGGRQNFLHWWNNWDGSYSGILFHDLIAPLGATSIPRVFPTVVIALWWAGLFWLFRFALSEMGFQRNGALIGIALAALTTGAAVNGFYTWESIYWYTACVDNTLPVGGMLIYLAIAFKLSRRRRSRGLAWLAAIGGAALCFVIGGFSEMFSVFQLAYLSLILAAAYRFDLSPRRNARLRLFAAGCFGSIGALLLQLAAPGVTYRIESAATIGGLQPVRSASTLVIETLGLSLEYLGHRGGIGGFMLMLAVGVVISLGLYRARSTAGSPALAMGPPALGLLAQIGCIALLSTGLGERPPGEGAASPLAAGALACELLSGGLFTLLIWRRKSLEAWLRGDDLRLMAVCAGVLAGAQLPLGLAQLPGAAPAMSASLFITALAWLGNLLALLLSSEAEGRCRRPGRVASLSLALAAIAIALPVAVGLYFNGVVYSRVMPSTALAIVLAGLAWGVCIGGLMRRVFEPRRAGLQSLRAIRLVAGVVAAAILLGVAANQLRLAPRFAAYASDWDARRERIIQMKADGAREIDVAPFSFDMTAFIAASGKTIGGSDAYFYGVDSIRVVES